MLEQITEWEEAEEEPGYRVATFKSEKAIITIHWPVLDDEEQTRRMEAIKRAAERLVIETYRLRALREREAKKANEQKAAE